MSLESEAPKKKVLIETWGCQMNVADSEQMLGLLEKNNYESTTELNDADLVILNTCHIREKAKNKVLSRLGRLKEFKENRKGFKIAVTGCVAQAEGKKLLKQAPVIDFLIGPGKINDLPDLLNGKTAEEKTALGFYKNPYEDEQKNDSITTKNPLLDGKSSISRFVNIQQGCNNFCTFCVVPFTRGREVSRRPKEILAEMASIIADGAKEITLLGQNVNSYGLDLVEKSMLEATARGPFTDLLDAASKLPGLERLRFTTSNPHDFSLHLAELFREHATLGKYIHLPVQSGSNEVLERMKRKVTVSEYFERINWLRSVDEGMAISTDLIVGFPGETEAQFEETVDLVKKVQFSFIYSFKYSSRPNTAAARFRDQVSESEKDRRLQILNDVQNEITVSQNRAEIGKNRQILFQYESKKEPGVFYGRTEHFRLVKVKASRNLVGMLLNCEIIDANKIALEGRLV